MADDFTECLNDFTTVNDFLTLQDDRAINTAIQASYTYFCPLPSFSMFGRTEITDLFENIDDDSSDDDDDSFKQLQVAFEKLCKTGSVNTIDGFYVNQDTQEDKGKLVTENFDLKTENFILKQQLESMKKEVGEYEKLQTKKETSLPNDPCAICQEDFQAVRTLKCRHSFHSKCIRKWLAEHESCPICRSSAKVSK